MGMHSETMETKVKGVDALFVAWIEPEPARPRESCAENVPLNHGEAEPSKVAFCRRFCDWAAVAAPRARKRNTTRIGRGAFMMPP
jgi:hypothetical protein